jgi:hypothetical protein
MTSEKETSQESGNDTLHIISNFLLKTFLFVILLLGLKLMAGAVYGFYKFINEMPFV